MSGFAKAECCDSERAGWRDPALSGVRESVAEEERREGLVAVLNLVGRVLIGRR